ncbi:MAG: helix-hairpin-helix domain-containing protein [Clostridiales bacterium]|nr:helix-hairpin-helix domain-containing protein [Clostridiales bacterium]
MDKRKIWITSMLLVLGIAVCAFTTLYPSQKSIIVETSETEDYPIVETSETEDAGYFPVYLSGQVRNPGIYEIKRMVYLYELVEMAGGFTDEADQQHIDLVYPVDRAQSIYIPSADETGSDSMDMEFYSPSSGKAFHSSLSGTSSARRININTADAASLVLLPGIGDKTAQKIIDYREENGSFACVEDIMNVPGIGKNKFMEIQSSIYV